ncbi:MAG TPA: phosphatidylserine/phosphatidylglycerophosphate/cardiolipin synthase family protein [Candidatus Saccharimonadales bacterium]|nr:phosphatidylserine/phosphatidylglycerophosphate/cardiolipin synthase family protein [Candidatus Saccharimonadales bacterium]
MPWLSPLMVMDKSRGGQKAARERRLGGLYGVACPASLLRFLGFCAILILAGCASTVPHSRYLQQIEPSTQTNLTAYCSGTNLDLRIPLRGRDAFVHASWSGPTPGATNYQHRFAVLDFKGEKRAARRSLTTKTNRLVIHDLKQWQQLMEKVFAGLAPAQPNHAVLLLLLNQALAVFHDTTGKLRVVKLEDKPPGVVVDRTANDADFAREAFQLLEASALPKDGKQSQFLFATGENPAFVLVDSQERLIVFLDYPIDPETQPVPVWFAVRALNSLIVRSLLVTAIKNPVTLVYRGFWHLGTSGAAAIKSMVEDPAGPLPPLSAGPPMDLAAWEKDLHRIVSARRQKGRLDLLIDGENFFSAFMRSVANATRSVDVLVYIFDTDDYAINMADLLKERSRQVKVKVLFDDMGSLFAAHVEPASPMPPNFQRPANIKSYLKAGSRVEVRASANPWLTVDHRKCIIVDGREAFIGGMNIGRNYRYDWHDLMARLTGPIVGRFEKDYRMAWAHAGPLGDFAYAWAWLFDRTKPRRNAITNAIDLRPLRTATGKREIYRAQLGAIERAHSYISIETPYFDDDSILRALIRARQRGVNVRVIFPARNDSGVMQVNNALVAGELVRNGIRVYAYPGMTHVKAAIYDGWACLGSANLDKMSLHVGQELDVGFSDPATVERLKVELFEKDFSRSHEITEPGATSWFDSVVKVFTDQL